MKRQAAYHGEIGANGRAYNKGQFIAEQLEYTAAGTKKKAGKPRKQEIEPYVWAVPESPEMLAIMPFIVGMGANIRTGEIKAQVVEFNGANVQEIEDLLNRYQKGERWFIPN